MEANSSFIGVCDQEPFRLPEMQDQKSLTLCWRSFEDGAGSVFHSPLPMKDANGSIMCIHYQVAVLLPYLQDQKLLTLHWRSFWRGGRERVAFCFAYRGCQHIDYVYSLSNRVFYYPTYRTKNCWRSVDAHLHDGAGSVFLTLLPIKDANTLIMCIHYQVAFLLPDLQDQKSLMLRWRSFSRWGRERVAFFFPYTGCQNF